MACLGSAQQLQAELLKPLPNDGEMVPSCDRGKKQLVNGAVLHDACIRSTCDV